jgi:hypothetical protein
MATVTMRCGNVDHNDGDVRATLDAVHISCEDAPSNDDSGEQKLYRFRVTPDDVEVYGSSYSEIFSTNPDGTHTWEGYVFPAAGAHTVHLHDELEDSDLATLAVTVVEPD